MRHSHYVLIEDMIAAIQEIKETIPSLIQVCNKRNPERFLIIR